MDREIKFRAWDKNQQKMVEVERLRIDAGAVDTLDTYVEANNDNVELLQYTGLTDKNGDEIYEGDIVSVPYIDPVGNLHKETENHKSVVVFEHGEFAEDKGKLDNTPLNNWCEQEKGKYISNYGKPTIKKNKTTLEVIGNKFENPELLD